MTRLVALVIGDATAAWHEALQRALPGFEVRVWPFATGLRADDLDRVEYLIGWVPPAGVFAAFPALKAVFPLGAGVDRFVGRADLPPHIPIIRLTDAGMARQMIDYVLYGVLRHQRAMDVYQQQQGAGQWWPLPPRSAASTTVGVLGLGEIGGQVAAALAGQGYDVAGWSRSAKTLPDVACWHGADGLDPVLARSEVLVNILPSTPETRGLLNAERLARLPVGASVINVGRGDQLDLTALIEGLDSGHLRSALLDVFPVEPLPPEHPVWRHPKVSLTPHVAADSLPEPAAAQIADKLRRFEAGETVAGLVIPARGY